MPKTEKVTFFYSTSMNQETLVAWSALYRK